MLWYLIPDVYMEFSQFVIGNKQILHLVVSTADSSQIQDLVCRIMQDHLKILNEDNLSALITVSLNWETFEQYCLWQVIAAHDFPIERLLPILPTLQYQVHAEALTSIIFILKQAK